MATFDEATHTYQADGVPLISVTTLLSSWFKKFNPDETIRMMKSKPSWPESKYYGSSDEEIKAKWATDGKEASALGTQLHAAIEEYYKTGMVTLQTVEMGQFLRFAQDRQLTMVGIEHRVFDKEWRLAGTIDGVAKHGEELDLYDWKRCKEMNQSYGYAIQEGLTHVPSSNFWKYSLQLNLYRALMEKQGNRIHRMYVVCFHPDHVEYQVYEVGRMNVEKILNSRLQNVV
jgi:ATP-dependent exoDNAse (exonuclease V) beta subunit